MGSLYEGLSALIRVFLNRLQLPPHHEIGRERGQALVRVATGLIVFTYLLVGQSFTDFEVGYRELVFGAGFIGFAIAILAVTLRATMASPTRRLVGSLGDVCAVSYAMVITGTLGIPLFVLYLFLTVGNGLRFGSDAMISNAVLSLIGFSSVVVLSPLWHQELTVIAAALIAALIFLPIAARFVLFKSRKSEERARVSVLDFLRDIKGAVAKGGRERVLAHIRLYFQQIRLKHDELARERGQAMIRVVISLLLFVYLVSVGVQVRPLFIIFIAFSVVMAALAFHGSVSSPPRRVIANVADIGMISYVMVTTGDAGIPLFVLYLWVTLGNGLRFGPRAMISSAILSVIGFSVVILMSPIWRELTNIAVAVMAALVALPLSTRFLRNNIKGSERIREFSHGLFQRIRMALQSPSHLLSRERGQAITRLVVSTVLTIYLVIQHYPIPLSEPWLLFCFGFLAFSGAVVALALNAKESSVIRRTIANIADAGAIGYLMIATGEIGMPLFITYLWITLGNGFRFGVNALVVSSVLSVISFSVVIVATDVWQAHSTLAAGVWVGLLVIPGYAAHLIRQLHEARQRAEEASAAKSLFLARMSHELRTPLNGILGTTELLSNSKRLTRDDRSLLDVIRDSVKVSMRQIDNVLDFSKIEAGKLIIEQVNFDLHALLNRAFRLVRATALEKNLRLTLRIDPAMPYRLVGDPHHLHEVLLNLLSNAIKFTEKGYVSLEARLLDAGKDSARVRFEVYDTGIGIEPTAINRIFEAFTQEDGGTTRRYGGTGLGTTIAKQLVELMGGELRVESTKGKGSRFYADIPFARQAPNEEKVDRALAGLRVLLVAKESDIAEQLGFLVKEWNVLLATVPTLAEATGFLGRSIRLGNPVNAILVDGRVAFANTANHVAGDFIDKAWLSSTPVFLICDVYPDEARLREWGYGAVFPYSISRALLFNALRATNANDVIADQGVIQVEPWAWRQQAGRPRSRLLIADDNRTNLMILERILDNAGYQVETAKNGEEALDKLLHGRYKVAVIDMHMPGLDGVEVVKQYRALRVGARTPIIMLTANATMDAKLESADAGADAYLTKPATAAAVLSTIRKLLEDREIYELKHETAPDGSASDLPIIDTEVITELAWLYQSPEELNRLLDTFEAEGTRLLRELQAAAGKKNHAAFCELVHALKGNGANVGALRLARACSEVEKQTVLDFHREGKQIAADLTQAFAEAAKALRDFTATSESGSARDLDRY